MPFPPKVIECVFPLDRTENIRELTVTNYGVSTFEYRLRMVRCQMSTFRRWMVYCFSVIVCGGCVDGLWLRGDLSCDWALLGVAFEFGAVLATVASWYSWSIRKGNGHE